MDEIRVGSIVRADANKGDPHRRFYFGRVEASDKFFNGKVFPWIVRWYAFGSGGATIQTGERGDNLTVLPEHYEFLIGD